MKQYFNLAESSYHAAGRRHSFTSESQDVEVRGGGGKLGVYVIKDYKLKLKMNKRK